MNECESESSVCVPWLCCVSLGVGESIGGVSCWRMAETVGRGCGLAEPAEKATDRSE